MPAVYLFVEIDVASRQVVRALILTDQQPSQMGFSKAYARLASASAPTLAEASRKMREQIQRSPFLQWVLPLLPPDPAERIGSVVRARRPDE